MSSSRTYIFGPVPSRRLGRSLGIDVIPAKICTLDCLYCEAGATTQRVTERRDYIPPDALIAEMRQVLPGQQAVDWVTFTGTGEPTLHASLGRLIAEAKELSPFPVAVLTNGTLIDRTDVQDDLLAADAVLPSLDAASAVAFRRLNRPAPGIGPERIITGLINFRRRYRGQIWLEILLTRGFNDSDAEVEALMAAVNRIVPDKIHLNTVVRPPAYPAARPVPARRLEEIAARLGPRCEIVCASGGRSLDGTDLEPEQIADIVARRPMTAQELASAFRVESGVIETALRGLLQTKRLLRVRHGRKEYYETPRERTE